MASARFTYLFRIGYDPETCCKEILLLVAGKLLGGEIREVTEFLGEEARKN